MEQAVMTPARALSPNHHVTRQLTVNLEAMRNAQKTTSRHPPHPGSQQPRPKS